MNKRDAKKIVENGISIDDIKAMLWRAVEEGAVDDSVSSANKGMSKSVVFNIFWGAYKDKSGTDHIKGLERLGASNAVWEFGDYLDDKKKLEKKKIENPKIEVYHEENKYF